MSVRNAYIQPPVKPRLKYLVIKLLDDITSIHMDTWTHGPDPTRSEVIRAVQEMKTRAEDTEETPQQIIIQSV